MSVNTRIQSIFNRFTAIRAGAILLLAFSLGAAQSATINVPADQPTLQAAALAAASGDTVTVAGNATYVGSATFTVPITINSSGAPIPIIQGQIILAGAGGASAVTNLQISGSLNHGLLIANATGSTVLVDGCAIISNGDRGIQIDANDITVTVQNCTISDNSRRGIQYDKSGTIGFEGHLIVNNCMIERNGQAETLSSNSRGRGIEVSDDANGSLTITNTTITVTPDGTSDRGIELSDSDNVNMVFTMSNVTIQAPLYNPDTLMGNNNGMGINFQQIDSTLDWDGVTIIGFRHCSEIKSRNADMQANLRNLTYQDWTRGRGMYFDDIGSGNITLQNVSMIALNYVEPLPYSGDKEAGDEGLRLTNTVANATFNITNLTVSNIEEAFTVTDATTVVINATDVNLFPGVGRGAQGFKIEDSDTLTINVYDSLVTGFSSGTEILNGCQNSTFTWNNSMITGSSLAARIRGGANNQVTFTDSIFYDNGPSSPFDVSEITDVNYEIDVNYCTFHENSEEQVQIRGGVTANVDVTHNIFSDYGNGALLNDGVGALTENFNVFVDPDIATFPPVVAAGLGTVTSGGGSRQSNNLIDVFCSVFDPLADNWLNILMSGPAFQIDGSTNAGAKPVCIVPSSMEGWLLYQ